MGESEGEFGDEFIGVRRHDGATDEFAGAVRYELYKSVAEILGVAGRGSG